MFSLKKMFAKGAAVAASAGIFTGGACLTLPPEVDTSDRAIGTALVTLGTFLWGCFNNWRKNK